MTPQEMRSPCPSDRLHCHIGVQRRASRRLQDGTVGDARQLAHAYAPDQVLAAPLSAPAPPPSVLPRGQPCCFLVPGQKRYGLACDRCHRGSESHAQRSGEEAGREQGRKPSARLDRARSARACSAAGSWTIPALIQLGIPAGTLCIANGCKLPSRNMESTSTCTSE